MKILKLNWDVSTFHASFPTAQRPQTWSLGFNHLVLGYPPHLAILVSIQFCQATEVSLCVSFCKTSIQLPLLAQQSFQQHMFQWGQGTSHWEKNISLFLPWNLTVILKLVSYSEIIEQSGCSFILLNEIITTSNSQCSNHRLANLTSSSKDSKKFCTFVKQIFIPPTLSGSRFIPYFTVSHTASSCISIYFSVVL